MRWNLYRLSLLVLAAGAVVTTYGQNEWPKSITAGDGALIKIYQPQTEYFAGNQLKSRSAFSIREPGMADPVFGTFWSTETVSTDRDTREVIVESAKVNRVKLQSDSALIERDKLVPTLQSSIPQVAGVLTLDEVMLSLNEQQQERKLTGKISNTLPTLIYRTKPSMLVLIDGYPILQKNTKWGVDMVVNSPFVIIRFKDDNYYLHGGGHWYVASSAGGPYSFTHDHVKHKLKRIAKSLENTARKNDDLPTDEVPDYPVYDIVVSTVPAELIQTNGAPDFIPIPGTSLLYIKNSDNDIFMDTRDQHYYVLLSGRWYSSSTLGEKSAWKYVSPGQLPADFALIPEGSPKDGVLASVPGTPAAKEAVIDAEIAQTAKIDRRTANTRVEFDGMPIFKPIQGTDMRYAVNTSSTVLEEGGRYYALDNGVWFTSETAAGPWQVSTTSPAEMDLIPPDCPVFNAKYVSVYDANPDYVYDGYTSGYLNSYVDGPTVVYGTGYSYDPWIGMYYYPRPWTWGFDMCYNPWSGWGFGAAFDYDWFDDGFGWDDGLGIGWGGWYGGGWWGGATAYRPCYRNWHGGRFRSDQRGGYYGQNVAITKDVHMHMRFNNNVYRGRPGIIDPTRRVAASGTGGEFNGETIFTDRLGNVYRYNPMGRWEQNVGRNWSTPVSPLNRETLEQQRQIYNRGQVRSMNFQRASNYGGLRFSGGSFGRAQMGGGSMHTGGGHFGGHR